MTNVLDDYSLSCIASAAGAKISSEASIKVYFSFSPKGKLEVVLFYCEPGQEKRRIQIATTVDSVGEGPANTFFEQVAPVDFETYKPLNDTYTSWLTGEVTRAEDRNV